jgi:hypothetical protein
MPHSRTLPLELGDVVMSAGQPDLEPCRLDGFDAVAGICGSFRQLDNLCRDRPLFGGQLLDHRRRERFDGLECFHIVAFGIAPELPSRRRYPVDRLHTSTAVSRASAWSGSGPASMSCMTCWAAVTIIALARCSSMRPLRC